MKYLIKRCGHQELGSMDSSLRPQRGQYLMMSKQSDVLSFFPALSSTQQNDFRLVPIYPLYCEGKIYCRFVYHNDKFHGSTASHPRNEYRLYLNREVQGGELRFFEDGLVVFRMVDETDFSGGLFVDYAAPSDANYAVYAALLSDNKIGGGENYAVYNGVIDIFESRAREIDTAAQDIKVAQEDLDFISKSDKDVESLFNLQEFRDFVSVGYQHRCAITGTVIAYGSLNNLEAAHIRPQAHAGPNLPCNGISLCRDFHWAFDHGFLTLTDDCRVKVSTRAPSDLLMPYDGKKIYMPADPFFRPRVDFIHHHQKHVFEHFEQIRAFDRQKDRA